MQELADKVSILFEQVIRLLQLVGIPVMGVLFIVGFIILLTSGKNPRRKRAGYIMTIVFGIGILLVSYVPLLAYKYGGEAPKEATGDETIYSMVDSSAGLGSMFFTGLKYAAIPLTFTMFYIGIMIVLLAAKSPQRKRLGIGISLLSPITLAIVFLIPVLLPRL
ncbi:hypothetical protein [Paenibacillus antri]|uniref:hypothetical protein n=1 Tax=Paenibacillus antri TaxID=2582848 RepID=UPI00130533D9|nr:hypothetical protein [Paenibacillus antri]